MVTPKKHLGQHFLTDLGKAQKVALTLQDQDLDLIIEVGCGKGVLSDFLFELYDDKVLCTDVDQESLDFLREKYPDRVDQIIEQDFLSFKPSSTSIQLAIIGNYPYNISSQIVFKVLEYQHQIQIFSGMFQKEVAQRLCAKPGTKAYGILSVLLQTFFEVSYLFSIGPGAFYPPPKVQSGVIVAKRKKDFELKVPFSFYKAIVKAAFNQRRKMLRNSLSSFKIQNLSSEEYFTLRPEELSFVQFHSLAQQLYLLQ